MKKALLISGLHKNYEPFINNQINLLINNNNFDIFISTSNENNYRIMCNNKISYVYDNPIINDEQYFYNKYKNVKKVIIDDGKIYDELCEKHNLKEISNFHQGLIKSYLKVNVGINEIYKYENDNDFKYDIIFRIRMDSFLLKKIIIDEIAPQKNQIVFSITSQHHKDDSCFLIKRENLDIMKNFVFHVIETAKKKKIGEIHIENLLFKYCENNKLLSVFICNLVCRIGGPTDLLYKNVPFFNKNDIYKLKSLEYEIKYE